MLLRFDNGATGSVSVGQVCAGHKNDLVLEVCGRDRLDPLAAGASERAVARSSGSRQRDPAEGSVARLAATSGATRGCLAVIRKDGPTPSRNVIRDIYEFIAAGKGPADDASAGVRDLRRRLSRGPHRRGDSRERQGRRRLDDRMSIRPFEPTFMPVGILTAALQELTPRDGPRRRSRSGDRGLDRVRARAGRRRHPAVVRAPSERSRRAAGSDARSGGQHARPAAALRQGSRAPRGGGAALGRRSASPTSATSTTCFTTTRRSGGRSTSSLLRVFDAAVLLGVDAVCGFVGRNQRRSMDENLVAFETGVRPAAEGSESARAHLPRRTVSDAGLDHRATTFTTTSPTRRARGSRCTGFASGMASAISSGFTTTRRTRS